MSAHDTSDAETDEHGLVVHRFVSTVLVVVPTSDYAETTFRYARSALHNVRVGTRSVANDDGGLLAGEFQDEFQVDGPIAGESMEAYSGLLICGGAGAASLETDENVLRLVRDAAQADKLIGTWGRGIGVLAAAGVLSRRRVTGDPELRAAATAAGARWRGTQVEVDGRLVTAFDDAAGFRFGKALVSVVRI